MARVDLKKASGFPIIFDGEELVSDELHFSNKKVYLLSDLKVQLLNEEVTCPDVFYTHYSNWDQDNIYKGKKLSINFGVVMPNLAGIEFVKTKAVSYQNHHRLIEIVNGGGVVLAQDFDTNPEGEIVYANVKKGSKLLIPAGFEVCISNTKTMPLIYVDLLVDGANFSDSLDDMRGLSYYVIRKNAKQEIVRNPEYRLVSKPRKVNFEKVLTKMGITSKTPIIKQILRKYEKFSWFFNSTDITI